jgi:hypothetical protein|eukprot:COSAG03_NODE_3975_length_1733_cov_3.780294_2_plen_86_part_00
MWYALCALWSQPVWFLVYQYLQQLTHESAQYLDGAHEWHHDGFAHLLIDLMLRPGGIIEFDDYWWHVLMLLFIGFAHCCQRGRVC